VSWAEGYEARGLLLRGVVLRTYLPDDPAHPGNKIIAVPDENPVAGVLGTHPETLLDVTRLRQILCDVLIYSPGYRAFLRLVPLAQPWGHGAVEGAWYPRACYAASTGTAAQPVGDPDTKAFTSPDDLDGDHVLVGFLEDDLALPIILYKIHHPSATRALAAYRARTATQGPTAEYLAVHRGTVIRIDSDGNIYLDATGASKGQLGIHGEELPGTGGKITILAKASQTVDVKAGLVAVEATATTVTVKAATKVILDAPEVDVGASSLQAMVVGGNFASLFNTHLHGGPGAPPSDALGVLAPMGNPAAQFAPHLSTVGKVKP
jgi:hypothetical protein